MTRSSGLPVLVTGLPRSGTSWVGKMLEASGGLVYINEPLNPQHPPGRSPGVLDAVTTHRFQYICEENESLWLPAFQRTADLRYGFAAELRANRSAYDLARLVKYGSAFAVGRARGRRALFDDPFAVLSARWFADRLGCEAVVLVRDPVTFVGSWRKLGWTVHFHELLEQELLVRDHLGPYVDRMRAMVGSRDWVARVCLLWEVAGQVVAAAAQSPRVTLVRYEDLATVPLRGFEELYRTVGLPWTPGARARVAAGTTRGGAPQRSHAWTIRGGLSRTAFQPMDSSTVVATRSTGLTDAESDRVRELTAGAVRELERHLPASAARAPRPPVA